MLIVNKMPNRDTMMDVTIIEKILRLLKSKLNHVVCSIKESEDIDLLSIVERVKSFKMPLKQQT